MAIQVGVGVEELLRMQMVQGVVVYVHLVKMDNRVLGLWGELEVRQVIVANVIVMAIGGVMAVMEVLELMESMVL